MTDIKENTHIVIKRDDATKYLSEKQKHDLDSILLTINTRREKEGKPVNNYLVINKDEPYAKIIQETIISNEKSRSDSIKRLDNEISSKKCTAYEDGCEEWAGCPCVNYKAE